MKRNSGYEDLLYKQRQSKAKKADTQQEELSADEAMRQLFGHEEEKPTISFTPKKMNIENLPITMKDGIEKKGFIAIGIVLLVTAIFLMGEFRFLPFLGGTAMAVLSFVLAWKVKYRYTAITNFYFSNFTVTLKGLLEHYRTTSILMEGSEKIMIYSVALMAVQHFFLSWFSLTSLLYSLGYYGFFLGIILNLAKRKTMLIYKGLFLNCLLQVLFVLQNGFGGSDINYYTVSSLLLFWYLACFFKYIRITDVKRDENNEEDKEEE
ncbi:hypothetical protein PP175_25990 (plasmid) [Aneurinibacillus sp. Ricciae_BoGa-3]|uniref:hypothetical protein n=1 Tax=Aneurinibacillus sp. Ricciae_BoGa-3 TaxID=3022697 RepID=UPI0023412E22|nr:hypothetical protein [Aneurinibacillus sp. Ricciae_BoGa-3]WCK57520.1 hypothetical protein PP175_25990 [Aneurinibacillus sp. Ricciae_BoGa-3]